MAVLALLAAPASAQDMSLFRPGPVFADFGPHAPVAGIDSVPAGTEFAVAFDVADAAREGERNKGFESAAANGVSQEDLLPGVEMALSAMTAHALLQQRGYTVNPF